MKNAIFIDLDHTIIKPTNGKTFPDTWDDMEFIDTTIKQIDSISDHFDYLVIVSNQGGIEQGHISKLDYLKKIKTVMDYLGIHTGFNRDEIKQYFAETLDNRDPLRKPNPGMALTASADFNINLSRSIMIGDLRTDLSFASKAGIGGFAYVQDFQFDSCTFYRPILFEI